MSVRKRVLYHLKHLVEWLETEGRQKNNGNMIVVIKLATRLERLIFEGSAPQTKVFVGNAREKTG